MTGDDHGSSGTDTVFDQFRALDPPGCSVADWQCVRATGYVFPGVSLSPPPLSAIDYQQLGFEIALHLAIDGPSCRDFADVPSLEGLLTAQFGQFQANFPGIDAPTTIRTHCIAWSDWDSQPKADLEHGIRLNTDYYWYSSTNWDQDRSGVFTGSGMPMRFTAADGSLIDVFQAATYSADDATDSPNTVVPAQMEGLIDRALGPEGYYGAFTVIIHNDAGEAVTEEPARTEVVKYAQSKGVSIISERQLLTWLDGRDSSSFGGLRLDGGRMTFTIAPGAGARGLQAMVPVQGPNGTLQALTRGSAPVQYVTRTIKGVEYALFPAAAGDYAATYPAPPPPPPPPGGSGDNGGGASGASGATGTTGTTGSTGSTGSAGSAAGARPSRRRSGPSRCCRRRPSPRPSPR
jgi:hypothetical protein